MNEQVQKTADPGTATSRPKRADFRVRFLPCRRARRWRHGRTSHRACGQANRRYGCANARLQRLDSRADVQGSQGATVTVHVTNEGDLEATVHWHGLRLENRFDGT